MTTDKTSDPYTYLIDSRNAIDEYYKLKAQLTLTADERLALTFGQSKGTDIIQDLRRYVLESGIGIKKLAERLDISYVALHNLLTGKVKAPYGRIKYAIYEFMKGVNNGIHL